MLTFPWFFCSSIFVITIVAHSFGIMFSVIVSTIDVLFFTEIRKMLHFLFVGFKFRLRKFFFFFRLTFERLNFFGEELNIEVHVLINELLLMGEELVLRGGEHLFHNWIGLRLGCRECLLIW